MARLIGREPFQKRTWAELGFFLASSALAYSGVAPPWRCWGSPAWCSRSSSSACLSWLADCGSPGASAAGSGHWLERVLGEQIADPEPFTARPGFFGWLRASLGDQVAWRAVGYFVAKVPLTVFGVWFALSVWVEALLRYLLPVDGG